jgi:GGDEF domain-containing protein
MRVCDRANALYPENAGQNMANNAVSFRTAGFLGLVCVSSVRPANAPLAATSRSLAGPAAPPMSLAGARYYRYYESMLEGAVPKTGWQRPMTTSLFSSLLTVIAVGLGAWCLYLRRELRAALVDQAYGILTRLGGERTWKHMSARYAAFEVVFLDLDDLHQLNTELGYAEVDRRIRAVLNFRQEDIVMARWYSGDEIIAVVPKGDGAGFAQRLLCSLKRQQLSATFGIVPALPQLADAVQSAMQIVSAAKAEGRRGTVWTNAATLGGGRPTCARRAAHRVSQPASRIIKR